jgi:hypothetical protein
MTLTVSASNRRKELMDPKGPEREIEIVPLTEPVPAKPGQPTPDPGKQEPVKQPEKTPA